MLNKNLEKHINFLIERYPNLECIKENIIDGYCLLEECFANGNKLLIAGNGGSAADAEHIVGELMKGFKLPRECPKEFKDKLTEISPEYGKKLSDTLQGALPAIAFSGHNALSTAFSNDVDSTIGFAQQLYGYGKKDDILLAISTSGNSKNIMNATVVAKALDIKVIGLTGANGGELSQISDVIVKVPEIETYMIQELHLPIYHCWCLMLEDRFFGKYE